MFKLPSKLHQLLPVEEVKDADERAPLAGRCQQGALVVHGNALELVLVRVDVDGGTGHSLLLTGHIHDLRKKYKFYFEGESLAYA